MRLVDRLLTTAAALTLALSPASPAMARTLTKAPDTENGARVFAYVCSACHLGGYNQVRYDRTLQEAVLREQGMLAADLHHDSSRWKGSVQDHFDI